MSRKAMEMRLMNNAVAPLAPERFGHLKTGPLTFQQHSFRVLHRNLMNCMDGIYPYRLCGKLDVEALRKSIEEIVRRHGALRTRVFIDDHIQLQFVNELCGYQLERIPIVGNSDDILDVDAEARKLVEQFARQTVDLNDRPLF